MAGAVSILVHTRTPSATMHPINRGTSVPHAALDTPPVYRLGCSAPRACGLEARLVLRSDRGTALGIAAHPRRPIPAGLPASSPSAGDIQKSSRSVERGACDTRNTFLDSAQGVRAAIPNSIPNRPAFSRHPAKSCLRAGFSRLLGKDGDGSGNSIVTPVYMQMFSIL